MSTTKILFSMAAVGLLLVLPIVIFRQDSTPPPMPAEAPIASAKERAPQTWPRARETSPSKEANHYRPAPVSDEVRSKADAILRRHAGMSWQELMQSKEFVALVERMSEAMNSSMMNDPGFQQKAMEALNQLQTVTGMQRGTSFALTSFENLNDVKGRAWLEAAVSEDTERMKEWFINSLNGSIFELAVDPTLEKSRIRMLPANPNVAPADDRIND